MNRLRKSDARGNFDHGWLQTWHTFAFADYVDPDHMGFRTLRVINEDRVQPGQGFATHSHRDMEIITVVLSGVLEHKDSMGNGAAILPGDVQRMSAGTGVTHSEFNGSDTEPVHLLQIWILPEEPGLPPGYEQKSFPPASRHNRLLPVASRGGRNGSLTIHQDAGLFLSELDVRATLTHSLAAGRHAWVQVTHGRLHANNVDMGPGDGLAVSNEASVELAASEDSRLLLFDLA